VYADFGAPELYFGRVFDLILSIFGVRPQDPAVTELVRLVADDPH
jgi:hypothetical protein